MPQSVPNEAVILGIRGKIGQVENATAQRDPSFHSG